MSTLRKIAAKGVYLGEAKWIGDKAQLRETTATRIEDVKENRVTVMA